jgi:molybdopterin-guanine dinucleotide biosynthesis protein A
MFQLLANHDMAVPKDDQYYHPLAAVYRLTVRPAVESLLAADRLRPVDLIEVVDALEVPVALLRNVDPELGTLKNLNCPEDYLEVLRKAGFSVPEEIRGNLR